MFGVVIISSTDYFICAPKDCIYESNKVLHISAYYVSNQNI
jgi:hypothetical protein